MSFDPKPDPKCKRCGGSGKMVLFNKRVYCDCLTPYTGWVYKGYPPKCYYYNIKGEKVAVNEVTRSGKRPAAKHKLINVGSLVGCVR